MSFNPKYDDIERIKEDYLYEEIEKHRDVELRLTHVMSLINQFRTDFNNATKPLQINAIVMDFLDDIEDLDTP